MTAGEQMKYYDVIIIGAGPAGLSAAGELAGSGLRTVVVDGNGQPGGQLIKQIHKFFGAREVCAGVRGIRLAQPLYEKARAQGCEFLMNTYVYSVFDAEHGYQVLADTGTHTRCLYGKTVLLAMGASENAIAFPGWTKPGVITAGAAQTMVNLSRVRVGKRVLMVGAGNVGLIVSYQLLQAGIDVAAVIEAAPEIGGYSVHANKIRRAGVPIYLSHTIVEARGEHCVESAVIAQVDSSFRVIEATKQELKVDTICLAVGLSPLIKLASVAGCRIVKNEGRGESIPWHNPDLMTSKPGIFVAGDVAGVEEASIAMEEGVLAACSIRAYLGTPVDLEKQEESVQRLTELRKKGQKMAAPKDPSPLYQKLHGPHAVMECYDEIPCNPCQAVCPTGAIHVGASMIGAPQLSLDKCVGCGKCVAACPGMACFLVNLNYSQEEAEIAIPYEYLPMPTQGKEITALSREGEALCRGRISRVIMSPGADQTAIVYFTVPKKYAWLARAIVPEEVTADGRI